MTAAGNVGYHPVMTPDAEALPEDPALLQAMVLGLQAEIAGMAAANRAYEALVQALKITIAKLKKQRFGPSSEKIERELAQLELALESLETTRAAADPTPEADAPEAEEAPATGTAAPDDAPPQRLVGKPLAGAVRGACAHDQRSGAVSAPRFQSPLDRSDQIVRIGAGAFVLQTIQELPSGYAWVGVEPRLQSFGHGLQRVRYGAVALLGRFRLRRGANFASRAPSDLEALKECIELWRVGGCGGCRVGNLDQGLLGRTDVPEQAHGIECRMLGVQRILQRLRRARVGSETLVRRQRRMIPLPDQRAFPLLLGKLERWLEEVHKQAHGPIETRKGFRRREAFEASIADHAAHDRTVLLFDMRLIVLAVRA